MRSSVALLLIFITLFSGLIIIKPAEPIEAQISPSVPEFSLKLEDHSYDVAPTYTTDPYTGKTVVATAGYHVERKFIDVVIKNPSAHSFYGVVNESVVKLYYNIRAKGHFRGWVDATGSQSNLAPSDSDYTTVKFGLGSSNPDSGGFSIWLGNIAAGGQVDFQVQGVNGFYTKLTREDPICWRLEEYNVFNETGRSAWSTTQTITIPGASASSATPSPTSSSGHGVTSPTQQPTIEPTQTVTPPASTEIKLDPITLTLSIVVVILAISVGVLIYLRRQGKPKQP